MHKTPPAISVATEPLLSDGRRSSWARSHAFPPTGAMSLERARLTAPPCIAHDLGYEKGGPGCTKTGEDGALEGMSLGLVGHAHHMHGHTVPHEAPDDVAPDIVGVGPPLLKEIAAFYIIYPDAGAFRRGHLTVFARFATLVAAMQMQ